MALTHLLRTSSKLSFACNVNKIFLSKNFSSLAQQPLKIMTITKYPTNSPICRQLFVSSLKNTRDTSHLGHNHTMLWTMEKALTVALIGVIPLAFLIPWKPMDYLLAISVVLHNHWGISAVCSDYLRPNTVGPLLSKAGIGLCYLFSILTLAGLLKLIKHDVGLVGSLKKLWALPAGDKQ